MANCRQACPYNTLDGCKVKKYNAICPLTNMATPITEYKMTNADHIRAMSIAELNDFLRKVSDHDDDCPYEYGSVKSLEWLGKPYVQKEYKKI